jgi:type IV secretion system protein VirB6
VASDFDFYQNLFTKLSDGLNTYWNGVASDMVTAITPVATTLVTIYVMLWGWSMMRGVIQEPITDGVGRIVRMAVIVGIALNVGYYNSFLADMLWNSPDALAGYVASGYSDETTNMQFLDSLMSNFYDMGEAYNDRANADSGLTGIPDLSLWFTGLAIWLSGVLVTGYAAFLFALSKMALAIVLGVGPIFILLTIFEPTKRFFDAWIGQALNYVFLVMLTAGAVKLVMTIIQTYLTAPGVVAALADPSINQALPAIIFSIIGMLVMTQLPSIASALGGGVAIGTLGAVAWAYGKTKGGVTAMRPTNLRRSMNKAGADWRITKSAAKTTVGMPGAVYRKITGGSRNRVARG